MTGKEKETKREKLYITIVSEASSLVKSMATLVHIILLLVVRTQTSGQPVKYQRSLKSPRKWLICYLTLGGKIAA